MTGRRRDVTVVELCFWSFASGAVLALVVVTIVQSVIAR